MGTEQVQPGPYLGKEITDPEITPAMIAAGIEELRLAEPHDAPSATVRAIYLAMAARRVP